MAQIDDTIATYLTAIDVEGKTANTVLSYRASLGDFRRVGRRFGFPDELEAYTVELSDLRQRREIRRHLGRENNFGRVWRQARNDLIGGLQRPVV